MIGNESLDNANNCRSRRGIVLLVTLVLLVVLSTLGYTLSSRVSAQRHRCHYIIDYQAARYGCDSAVKYALATLEDISAELISRPNEPDFSDLFALSEEEYQEILADWAARKALEEDEIFDDITDIDYMNDMDDINDVNDINDFGGVTDFNDPNSLTIPGPYGPAWPFVTKPAEFDIGSATVRIKIEDENAKYPVGWMLLNDKEVEREVVAGFETFCEWMDVNEMQIDSIKEQLKEISKVKPFKLVFKPVSKRTPIKAKTTGSRRLRDRRRARPATRFKTTTVPASEQISKQAAEFAKLFHSSLIDTETLARPTIISESRKESALKYMGMWGSTKVNINTAPRHVLEAAFIFGGDADKIAQEIILRRRTKPFKDINDLKESLLSYSDSIRKCENYITTVSKFFTIRVTAVSGVAEASAVIAITKDGEKTTRIAVISG